MKFILPFVLLSTAVFFCQSCKDEEEGNAPNEKFIGTYYGNLTCGSTNAQTLIITAGTGANNISMELVGDITLNGTVSGTSITIPAQGSIAGSGSLSGDNLTFSITTSSAPCTYSGSR